MYHIPKRYFSATIINGRAVARSMRKRIKQRIKQFEEISHRTPGLAIVLVGQRPETAAYMMAKSKICRRLGMSSFEYNFPDSVNEREIFATLDYLNRSSNVDGIFIQKPLPNHYDSEKLAQYIIPEKDVDGKHVMNCGKLKHFGDATLKAITPAGVMGILDSIENLNLNGQNVVIIGRSEMIGRPLNDLLLARNCTTTICHSYTINLTDHLKKADIVIIGGIGHPKYITGDMLKDGCIVIDCGTNIVKGGSIQGDCDFESCSKVASYITPVPGGVGPMTVAMLLDNTVNAAWRRWEKEEQKLPTIKNIKNMVPPHKT